MRESALREVLLVKAIEEADRAGALIPFGDRARAAREALRAAGIGSGEASRSDLTPAVERALADRASRLARPLLARHPVLGDILLRARSPAWTVLALLVLAFALGFGLSALEGSRRINILAPPFLGLILWNLLIYLLLAGGGVRRLLARESAGSGPIARTLSRRAARRLAPLLARTAHVDQVLGEAVERFAGDWGEAAAPLVGQHLRRWLHLGAAAIAAGLIAGLYLRGIVFRYEAGWESTFLEPPQVLVLIDLLFGRVASWSGIPLPRTVEEVVQLRWDGVGGGGTAAPWIHLIALCLAAIVVLPRLVLASAAWISGLRLQRAGHLPARVTAYARAALGADVVPIAVSVTPYAFEPPAGAVDALAASLARFFGKGARPELRPAISYGDEGTIRTAFDTDAHRVAGRVLLMNLAATPETENHGAVIVAARDHVRRARPEQRLLVLLDEAAYASRFATEGAAPGRLEERRRLWRDFVGGCGVEVAFTGATDAPPAR